MMIACRFFSLSELATDRFLAAFSALRVTGFGRFDPVQQASPDAALLGRWGEGERMSQSGWKAAAPSIDIIGPDIYLHDHRSYIRTLDLYMRPDNALFVPETGNGQEIARYFFEAVGRGGLGFAPFGMDFTGYVNSPLGAARLDEETIEAFARNYKLVEPMMRELAALRPQAHSVGLVAFRAAAKRQLSPSQRMRSSGSRRLACNPTYGHTVAGSADILDEHKNR